MNTYLTKNLLFVFMGPKSLTKKIGWCMFRHGKIFLKPVGVYSIVRWKWTLKRVWRDRLKKIVWQSEIFARQIWPGLEWEEVSPLLFYQIFRWTFSNRFWPFFAWNSLYYYISMIYTVWIAAIYYPFLLYVELTGCCRRFLSLFTLPYPFVLRCWMWFDALIRRPPKWHFVIFVTFFNMTPKLYLTI